MVWLSWTFVLVVSIHRLIIKVVLRNSKLFLKKNVIEPLTLSKYEKVVEAILALLSLCKVHWFLKQLDLPSMILQYSKAAVAQMTLKLAHFANIFPQKKWHANKRKRSGSEKTVETLLYSKNNENWVGLWSFICR